MRRIELLGSDWRCIDYNNAAQPIGHTRRNFGADGDNRNLFSGSEAQGTPYIPRPLETDSIVKDRGTMDTLRPSYFPGKVSSTMSQNSRIKRKKGRPFWWPPLLENRNVIPRRSGHLARVMIGAPLRTFDSHTELDNLYHATKY